MSSTYVRALPGALTREMQKRGLTVRALAALTEDPPVSHQAINQQQHPLKASTPNIELQKARSITTALGVDVGVVFAYPDGSPIGGAW